MQDDAFDDEDENEMKKEKMLKSMKKSLKRNSNFRHLTCNVGKRQKNGLCILEIEEGERIVKIFNKNEIERRIIKNDKEYFSKAKGNDAHNDKTNSAMNEEKPRDNVLNG